MVAIRPVVFEKNIGEKTREKMVKWLNKSKNFLAELGTSTFSSLALLKASNKQVVLLHSCNFEVVQCRKKVPQFPFSCQFHSQEYDRGEDTLHNKDQAMKTNSHNEVLKHLAIFLRSLTKLSNVLSFQELCSVCNTVNSSPVLSISKCYSFEGGRNIPDFHKSYWQTIAARVSEQFCNDSSNIQRESLKSFAKKIKKIRNAKKTLRDKLESSV